MARLANAAPCRHPASPPSPWSDQAVARAAAMLRAAGDPARLRLLEALTDGERCVTDLADTQQLALPAMSQRLRVLRTEGLVRSRRQGKHIYYALADRHVTDLILAVLDHADEPAHTPNRKAR